MKELLLQAINEKYPASDNKPSHLDLAIFVVNWVREANTDGIVIQLADAHEWASDWHKGVK